MIGLTPSFKGMAIKNIGFAEIDEWKRNRGSKISARSHNIELETLKILLRYACDRGILLDNRASDFKRRKQPKVVADMPSMAQFQALVKSLRESPKAVASGAADMVEFLAYSGMRVGEAREVRFRDVNFDLNTVLITGGELGTKNHEERTIPLFPNLQSLIKRIQGARKSAGKNDVIFEIISPRGAIILACKRTGLPVFTVHSLRHFFCSNAIEAGIDFKAIAAWLGHKDGGVLVAKTYGHLRAEHSTAMAKRMIFNATVEPENVPDGAVSLEQQPVAQASQ